VFSRKRRAIRSAREAFKAACRRAGIEDFSFHDLQHTAINHGRLAGHAATGHKPLTVFKRYNTVSKEKVKLWVGKMGKGIHLHNHHGRGG